MRIGLKNNVAAKICAKALFGKDAKRAGPGRLFAFIGGANRFYGI